MERDGEDLTSVSESLPAAKEREMAASAIHSQLMAQISLSKERKDKLGIKIDEARRQLKLKEEELKFLEMLLHRGEQHNRDLVATITNKEAEIAKLKEKLCEAEHKLNLAREEAQSLREQLRQAMAELAERARERCEIERTQAELERERSQFDMLLGTFAMRSQVNNIYSL